MSSLNYNDKRLLEELLRMGDGYVLDFTDRTFAEFFDDFGIDIDSTKYHRPYGPSKAKRLRSFWEQESDEVVAKVFEQLFAIAGESKIKPAHRKILIRLGATDVKQPDEDDAFLGEEFGQIDLKKLSLDESVEKVLKSRITEIQKCMKSGAWLAAVILCGSCLEGILSSVANRHTEQFNRAKGAPKDKEGTVRRFRDWTLSNLIDVAHELSFVSLDVKKFSHSLRDFRNFIHPNEQVLNKFSPDKHTASISWQVLCAAFAALSGKP